MVQPVLMSIAEACEAYSVGRTKLFDLAKKGEIEMIRVGRHRKVTTESLRQWVERLSQEASLGA